MKPARVLNNERISKSLYLIEVELLDAIGEAPKPFQFASLWIPRVKEIPLSISFLEGSRLRFVYKIRGWGTRALSRIERGSFIGLKIPLGRGIELDTLRDVKVLAVGGGAGIAPLPYLVKACHENNCRINVACGFRSGEEVPPIDRVFPLKPDRIGIATEDCSIGFCGDVLALTRELLETETFDMVIFVGPLPMLKRVCSDFINVDPLVSLETMVKCGLGICGSCYIPQTTKLLCIDGPVFRCSEVRSYLEQLPN